MTTQVSLDHTSHTFCCFVFCVLKRFFFVVCAGLVLFSCLLYKYVSITNSIILWSFFLFKVFTFSGFTKTLCWSLAFSSSTGSTGRLGCCPPGSYMSAPNSNPFSIAASCTACPNGWFARSVVENDDTSCDDNCPSGRYETIGAAFGYCTICPSGKYQPNDHVDASIACTTCVGSYIVDDGQNVDEHDAPDDCTFCPAGKEYLSTTTECTVCNAGKYQSSNIVATATCVPCVGRYIVDDGQNAAEHVVCKFCPAGKEYLSTTTECTVCNAGKYQSSDAAAQYTRIFQLFSIWSPI